MTRYRRRATAVIVSAAFAFAACGGQGASSPSAAATVPAASSGAESSAAATEDTGTNPALQQLYEAAKAEGSVTVWGQLDDSFMNATFAAFEARYPGIQPTFVNHNNETQLQLMLTALDSGQMPSVDVLHTKFQAMRQLYDRDAVAKDIDWASLGVPQDVIFPVAGGVTELAAYYGLAYNTNLVQPGDLPSKWMDLVNAKWKGKLSIDDDGKEADILSAAWGTDETVAYYQQLLDVTNPAIISGSTNGLLDLVAGNHPLRPAQYFAVQELKDKGAPIGFSPMDPVAVDLTPWWIVSQAAHPNAAKLFVAWQATPEAQAIAHEAVRGNVVGWQGPEAAYPTDFQVVNPSTPAAFETVANTTDAITELLAGVTK